MKRKIRNLKYILFRLKNNFWNDSVYKKRSEIYTSALHESLFRQYNKTRLCINTELLCYAPFKSLYFAPDGKAFACCYNRSQIIGTYPEQSIQEIWHSESISKLRNSLQSNDLTLGCYPCLTQIEERTFSSVLAANFDSYPLRKFPSLMEFELSNVCNLACVMCDGRYSSMIRTEREKLPPIPNPYGIGFVKELEEFIPHLSKAKFQGGEPFLISIYYDIWEKIIELNPKCIISVQTNGTVLNKRIESLLSRGNFHITISVDAISREVFESIRIRGDFQKVIDNIHYLRSYCKGKNTYFGVATCPMQQNWHEIPDIIKFCNNMDAPVTFNRVWHPPNCALWNTGSGKLNEIQKYYSQIKLPGSTFTQLHNKQQFNEFRRQIETWAEKEKTREVNYYSLEKFDNEALKSKLLNRIIQNSDIEYSGSENQVDNELLKVKIEKVLSHLADDKNYRLMLENLLEIPVEVLVNEFRKNPEEILLIQARNYLKEI